MISMFDPLIRLQQEILEASDDASRKYYEETPEKDRTGSGVTEVMRDAFMDEVSLLCLCASQFPLKYC
jgi:hypothetical protein